MAIKLPSHLHRSRSGILHFRIAIPADVRHHFASREIYRSLDTASVRDAADTAQTLSIAFKRAFRAIREQSMSDQENPSRSAQHARLMEWTKEKRAKIHYENIIDERDEEIDRLKLEALRLVAGHKRELDLVLKAQSLSALHLGDRDDRRQPVVVGPLFSEAAADYARTKLAAERWTEKTAEEYGTVYALFARIVGDRPISEIDHDVILTYLETLKKLPANMNRSPQFIGKSIDEIMALSPTPMAPRSINKNIERVSSLFKWTLGKKKYGVLVNPATGMGVSEDDAPKRQPFTDIELARLFEGEEFKARRFEGAYAYWLMPLALLTGARLGELCQLYLADFVEYNGVHCINISDEHEGQRVKNRSAKRLVPVHDKLIELGLLRYVDALRRASEDRLFPELSLRRDGFAHAASNWFQRYKERCQVVGKHTKVFHSFRHTFISSLLDDDVSEQAIAQIVGHEAKLITGRIYWNARDATKRKPTVDRYQPPQDAWRLVPKFEDVVVAG